MELNLNGEWEFCSVGGERLRAEVPGCNYTDLLRLGKLEDPFYGVNDKEASKIGEKDFIYFKKFNFNGDKDAFDKITLYAERLDTICTLKLNGKEVGKADNCHIPHEFDIKSVLKKGENSLEIYFVSPVNYVKKRHKESPAPRNNNGQDGIVHIRKPQCHFGWDWGPVLPPSGISGNICVHLKKRAEILNFDVAQKLDKKEAVLTFSSKFESFSGAPVDWRIELKHPDGRTEMREGQSVGSLNATVKIENPEIWWTRELSGKDIQPLYTASLTLFYGREAVSSKTKKIGLRTIALDRSKDEYGANFRFILNGVPLFIKGASYIPPDSFINRFDSEKLSKLLDAVQFSNLNMIRVWGGGFYGSDELFDECDRRGILVWQDFQFACQAYPFFEKSFLNNVKREVESNVNRLKHHASLALWCGNNEIESMSTLWFWKKKYIDWTDKFFYGILPEQVKDLDPVTPYIPGSPCGVSHGFGHGADNVGDTHIWAVWQGLEPFTYHRKRMTRFCSEFGFESLPDIKTIRNYAEEKDFSLTSDVFIAHQKCNGGNAKMKYFITSRYRLPARFEDYIYLSQLCQQECVRDATEHWRRNKGRCNGSMYWQLNDCWPGCSWSGMDYYYRFKALQYTARRFFAPVILSFEDGKDALKLFAINDKNCDINAEIRFKLVNFDGKVPFSVEFKKVIGKGAVEKIAEYRYSDLKAKCDLSDCIACAELNIDGSKESQITYLFKPEKKLSLPDPKITALVSVSGGRAEITLKAEKFARSVMLSSADDAPFSDNYFDLLPGESVIVTQVTSASDAREYSKNFKCFSLYDVKPEGSLLHDRIEALKVLLNPVNFFSKIYMASAPKDIPADKIK